MDNQKQISIDGQIYDVEIIQRVQLDNSATRIVIPALIINDTAREVLRVCIESIQKFTLDEVEIWIIDNRSPEIHTRWLTEFNDKLNLVLNYTEPVNPFRKPRSLISKIRHITKGYKNNTHAQMKDGSYANAIGLEIGRHCINPASSTIFVMHYDTLVTKTGWMRYLKSKLNDKVKAVGILQDRIRVNALHISGLLLDFTLFKSLQMSFLPNMRQERYPDRPEYDVGDQITLQLKANGFEVDVARNTFNNPDLSEHIPLTSPFREVLPCALSLDDDWDVFYMHLGRGTRKSAGVYGERPGKVYPEQWVEFADKVILR